MCKYADVQMTDYASIHLHTCIFAYLHIYLNTALKQLVEVFSPSFALVLRP